MPGPLFPPQRLAYALADICARPGANVAGFAFTVWNFHPRLSPGLPAHQLRGFTDHHQIPHTVLFPPATFDPDAFWLLREIRP